MSELSDAELERLASKVRAFLDDLSSAERAVIVDLLDVAGGAADPIDVEGFGLRRSDAVQMHTFQTEQAIDRAKPAGGGQAGGNQVAMDNMQRFLGLLGSMNPKI